MHIVKFQGGLGNQLFQLCLYFSLCEKYGEKCVYGDKTHYSIGKVDRRFELDRYYTIEFIETLPEQHIDVNESNYESITYDNEHIYHYVGYWQNETYFPRDMSFIDKCLDLSELDGNNKKVIDDIVNCQSVSIHVRRGDYINNYCHGNIVTVSYYQNAIDYILRIVDNPSFFVFSDDIKWCQFNIDTHGQQTYFIKGNANNPVLDIAMMRKCKYNIIANSSFSWWGQRLNTYLGKIVISPPYWYNTPVFTESLNSASFVHVQNVPSVGDDIENPKFSIILMSIGNDKCILHLRRCMSSILNQTLQEIEVIVINDISDNDSYQCIKKYSNGDTRLRMVCNDGKESLLASWIAAIRAAKGNYILFVNVNDYLEIDACELLDAYIATHKADIYEFAYVVEPNQSAIDYSPNLSDAFVPRMFADHLYGIWNKCYSLRLLQKGCEIVEHTFCHCNVNEDILFTPVLLTIAQVIIQTNIRLYHCEYKDGILKREKRLDIFLYNFFIMQDLSLVEKKNLVRIVGNELGTNFCFVYSMHLYFKKFMRFAKKYVNLIFEKEHER